MAFYKLSQGAFTLFSQQNLIEFETFIKMNSGYYICATQTVSKAEYIYCIFLIEVALVSQSSWEFSEILGKRNVILLM